MKILIVILTLLFSSVAYAWHTNEEDASNQAWFEDRDIPLWYARYAVHESANRADEVPLWEVLRWRALGPLFEDCIGDLLCSLHKYSAHRLVRPQNERTAAIARLNRQGDFPGVGFVSEIGWNRRYRAQWLRVLARADAWWDGGAEINCRYRPHHWGSRRLAVDRQRADRAIREGRWRQAECEGTSNGFFCVVGLCEEVRR